MTANSVASDLGPDNGGLDVQGLRRRLARLRFQRLYEPIKTGQEGRRTLPPLLGNEIEWAEWQNSFPRAVLRFLAAPDKRRPAHLGRLQVRLREHPSEGEPEPWDLVGLLLLLPGDAARQIFDVTLTVSPSHDPEAHHGLRKLAERLNVDFERATDRAGEIGLSLAWAERGTARPIRLGQRWLNSTAEPQYPGNLTDLDSLRRHLRREATKAAKARLRDRDYDPGRVSDFYDDGEPVPLEQLTETTTTEDVAAEGRWEALLEAANREQADVLEAATERQREILETLDRHLADLHDSFDGSDYNQLAEVKRRAAADLDVSAARINVLLSNLRGSA